MLKPMLIGAARMPSSRPGRLTRAIGVSSLFARTMETLAPNVLSLYCTVHGFKFQISLAYSAMVRSLENLPELAMFAIALRVQSS
jgi:hypothetical protein